MVLPSSTSQPPLRVALLLYPGCMPAGLFAAADMARAANVRAQASVMDIYWAGVDLSPVPTWQGPALAPSVALQHGRQYLGCELNPAYQPLQDARIADAVGPLFA